MKLIILLLAFHILPSNMVISQDTVVVYFDKDWNEISNKDVAVYYRNAYIDSNDKWLVNDYFMSSQMQMSGTYKSKKLKVRDGNFTYYYENGVKKSEGCYFKDKNEGEWIYWHDCGEKMAQGKYLNDKKAGIWNYWDTNGQLKIVETYFNGQIISVIGFFENGGKKFQGNYVNGLMQNEWTYWNADGRVTLKGNYYSGKKVGEWIRYFPEGEMKMLYKNNVLQGEKLGGIVINEQNN